MRFIDEATITVSSGKGGRGCVSFRRERYVPKGGPDGGDGGHGGSIIFKVNPGQRTLHNFKRQRIFTAPNGSFGLGKQKTGRGGKDLVIELPPGTIIKESKTGEVVRDMIAPGESFEFLIGGRGGKGNKHFTSSTNRAPRFAQPGEPGQSAVIDLELKLLADIGLIGLPNAGKSTLLSVISAARPKIKPYPFTTLTPNIGMVQVYDHEPFAVADIPGLIEGAHEGVGLGIKFLKHIERTRFLVHLIDAAAINTDDPLADFKTINNELVKFSPALAEKPQVVVLNKLDLPEAEVGAASFIKIIKEDSSVQTPACLSISAVTGQGISDFKINLFDLLYKNHE